MADKVNAHWNHGRNLSVAAFDFGQAAGHQLLGLSSLPLRHKLWLSIEAFTRHLAQRFCCEEKAGIYHTQKQLEASSWKLYPVQSKLHGI